MQLQHTMIAKVVLKKKTQVGRLTFPSMGKCTNTCGPTMEWAIRHERKWCTDICRNTSCLWKQFAMRRGQSWEHMLWDSLFYEISTVSKSLATVTALVVARAGREGWWVIACQCTCCFSELMKIPLNWLWWLHNFVNIRETIQLYAFKWVSCLVCEFCLNKAVTKNPQNYGNQNIL